MLLEVGIVLERTLALHAGKHQIFIETCRGLGVGDPGMTRTCDLRFRKPSLYPAELRDRSPAGGRGRLKAPYQSAVTVASLRIIPI